MSDLNELDQQLERTSLLHEKVREDEETSFDPDQMLDDLLEGVRLIEQARTLFQFISDPILCPALSKREKLSMERLSEKMKEHLCQVEATYDEVEEM